MKKLNLMLVASGSGTDARSIIDAHKAGFLPNIEKIVLVSTKKDVGCIAMAQERNVSVHVIDQKVCFEEKGYNYSFGIRVSLESSDLIFLVGNVVRIYPIQGVPMYNIHPANPDRHGGKGCYGLVPHMSVLEETVKMVKRQKMSVTGPFYTQVVVHEVTKEFDSGHPLLTQHVKVPTAIIESVLLGVKTIEDAAKDLQAHVLPFEWEMLPTAVNIATRRLLVERGEI